MKLLVLGAGGVGGYFGGRLAEAGVDVTFLVRPGRRAQLQRDGLRIVSPLGDLQMPVTTVIDTELTPGYDIVLLTSKAYDLESALDAIAPAMANRGAVVLPLLNGIAHLERLDQRFGRTQVLGGTCHIQVSLGGDGAILHTDPLQRITFGTRDDSQAALVSALADAFARTTIAWHVSDDIELDLWEKLVFLSVMAASSCLFRGNVREILAAPGGRDAMERLLLAAIEIATREGRAPRPQAIAFARGALLSENSTSNSSMVRDIETGRPVESDHVIGWTLNKARLHGIDDALFALAFTHLKTYEARRKAGRLPIIASGQS